MTNKREAELKSELTAVIKRRFPDFMTLALATAGAPDRVYVGNGVWSAWEAKHGTPEIESLENQRLFCSRLAHQGYCRYVVWRETNLVAQTLVVHPYIMLRDRENWALRADAWCRGFDMDWLASYIGGVHNVCRKPQNN